MVVISGHTIDGSPVAQTTRGEPLDLCAKASNAQFFQLANDPLIAPPGILACQRREPQDQSAVDL
jgi:hypothetical protein